MAFREFDYDENVTLRGKNEKEVRFSYIIYGNQKQSDNFEGRIGIIVKDWSRSCGYNVILEAERLQENTPGLAKVMVVANQFSGTARELAEKLGILTLTIGELVSIKSMYKQQFAEKSNKKNMVFDP